MIKRMKMVIMIQATVTQMDLLLRRNPFIVRFAKKQVLRAAAPLRETKDLKTI
jgi:hypothetical protein